MKSWTNVLNWMKLFNRLYSNIEWYNVADISLHWYDLENWNIEFILFIRSCLNKEINHKFSYLKIIH